jgi:hypothetical protein
MIRALQSLEPLFEPMSKPMGRGSSGRTSLVLPRPRGLAQIAVLHASKPAESVPVGPISAANSNYDTARNSLRSAGLK